MMLEAATAEAGRGPVRSPPPPREYGGRLTKAGCGADLVAAQRRGGREGAQGRPWSGRDGESLGRCIIVELPSLFHVRESRSSLRSTLCVRPPRCSHEGATCAPSRPPHGAAPAALIARWSALVAAGTP